MFTSTSAQCQTACPQTYNPVCGVDAAGVGRTFGNSCELALFNCENPGSGK